jgi:hypothetical protein
MPGFSPKRRATPGIEETKEGTHDQAGELVATG